jgi:hypothetical protein
LASCNLAVTSDLQLKPTGLERHFCFCDSVAGDDKINENQKIPGPIPAKATFLSRNLLLFVENVPVVAKEVDG